MKSIIISIFLIIVISGCQNQNWNYIHPTPSSDYMILNETKYIKEFPHSYTLDKGNKDVGFNLIGIRDFIICDSLLIVSTIDKEGLWSFYSLNNKKIIGKFLKQGNGPNEFFMTPFVSQASMMYDNNNDLNAILYESMQQKVLKVNITKSLEEGELFINELDINTPTPTFVFLMMDDSSYYARKLSNDETQQERSIFRGDTEIESQNLELLNKASVTKGNHEFNIISILAKYNPEKNLIVEAPIGLNYFNLYSPTDDFGMSICASGDEFNKISTVQKMKPWDRLKTYEGITIFKDFFGTLYIGEDMKSYIEGGKKLPKIHLFTWDGEPLAELLLPEYATSFDIDFINGHLYTLDLKHDLFYRYDIKSILNNIKKNSHNRC